MKKYSTIVLLGLLLSGCSAIAQSSAANRVPIYGEHVLVRAYDPDQEIIFGYGMPPQASQNPNVNPNLKRTTIAVRTYSTNDIKQIAELPTGYRVYDAQIISLLETGILNLNYVDICVFCGTKIIDNSYWIIDISGQPMLISDIDSTGFVGFFYLSNSIINSNWEDYVYIRQVEGTKHLFKMAAYAETQGQFHNMCCLNYTDNAVLDIVGIPRDEPDYNSCIARVKFYPGCCGGIKWDNDIRVPTGNPQEIVTDITGTDNFIITSSIFQGDTQSVYIRTSDKDTHYQPNGLELSNALLKLKLNNILIAPTQYNIYYKKPIRVTHLAGDEAVVSFAGANVIGNNNACNGLFSFRLNTQNPLGGAFDSIAGTLVDACRYKDTLATVTLVETSPHNYNMNTIRWTLNTSNFKYPVFAISDTTRNLNSIDTRKDLNNIQNLIAGGTIGIYANKYWKLLDHEYFNNAYQPYCFQNSRRNAPLVFLPQKEIIISDFNIVKTYIDDPIAYPVTLITRDNTMKDLNGICPKQ